jgi:hypothetical protein
MPAIHILYQRVRLFFLAPGVICFIVVHAADGLPEGDVVQVRLFNKKT